MGARPACTALIVVLAAGLCAGWPGAATASHPASVDAASRQLHPPRYPPAALRMGQQGTVTLVIHVNAQGQPEKVMVDSSSGHELLDQAAVDAAGQWRFHPAMQDGKLAPARLRVPVSFDL